MKKLIGLDTADQQPLYIQIREGLKNAIRERRLLPGEKLPSEQKLSRDLGVSVGILRKALAGLVEEGLICRRQNLGTTVADVAPEDIGRSPSGTIGVVFTNMLDGFMESIVKGIQDELTQRDYHMFLCDCGDDQEREAAQIASLVDKGADGLIIFPVTRRSGVRYSTSHYRRLVKQGIPFVFIDKYIPGVNADHVTFDNYGGARESVQHLIGLGHECIGIISTTEDATSVNDRLQGYKDAMEEAFGSVDKSLIKHHVPGSDDVPQLAHELLRRGATAVFCVLSYIALDLYSVFSDHNLSIPDDVSIIGFGAGRETEVVVPRLSTVHLPAYEMGEKAAEVLFAKICDGVKEVRHVSVPAIFVEGGSTAAHNRAGVHV